MLVIVAILLFVCLIVRHKWRNTAAKKDEILRLVAMTSQEEVEIAKLQVVGEYSSPPQQLPQLEKRYHCAVCYCPTTTRCSQCKAVRYCSGKCQIIHWRQGHKDDCQPTIVLHASKESKRVEETASENQFAIHLNDEAKNWYYPMHELDDSGSSSYSLPCFSSSTERSETSIDASVSEVIESGTHIKTDKSGPVGIDSHTLQNTYDSDSDSDDPDVPTPFPSNSTVYSVNSSIGANKIKKTRTTKTDECFHSTSCKDKRTGDGDAFLEEFVLGSTTQLRSAQSSSSLRTSSSAEDQKNQARPSNSKLMRSMSFRDSGNHQVLNMELKCSQCSKTLSTSSSDEYWKKEALLCNGKETRSMPFRSSGNYQKMSTKTGSPHTLLSEVEDVRMLSQPTGKDLKMSVRKFVQHFRAPKLSKSHMFDTRKDPFENNNYKFLFHPKLFMQLYSCDVELHPFGLVNCGNSCYANAVLQCLTFTRPITFYLLQGFHSKTCRTRDWCFICEFERLVRNGQEMNSPLSPVGILSNIQKIGSNLSRGREEDAHEFLRDVVDTMQSVCLEEAGVSGSLAEDSTLLGLTFGGYLQSKIKCMKCSGRFERCDRMLDLTVEIDGDIDTVEEALAQFTTSETLGGDDKYKCSRCKSYEKAKKKLTVLDAPNILTIVLKRFRSGNLEKLNKLVQFPEVLNLAPYMSGMGDKYPIYHLYAVVVHLNTMNAAYCGHYISYVKDFRGDWFRIDDSMVSPVNLETVLSVEAYILFYARHTPRHPSLPRTSSVYSDGKTKRNLEAISSSNSAKKKNSKTKPSTSSWSTECTMLHQPSDRHPLWISANDFTGRHIVDSEGWGFNSKLRSPILDSSSDSSSIFSASDAGSYSTDSTKDSSAEDISGYIFGSNWYH